MHAAATEAQSAALRTLLRSFGQIVLQPNAFTGACLLGAWLLYDPRLACAALIGAISANVSALLAGARVVLAIDGQQRAQDRKSTRLNSSHQIISYAVFCLKKKNKPNQDTA